MVHEIPPDIMRLAWRVDKAMERREGADRVFMLIEELSYRMALAGLAGAGEWVSRIPEDVEREGVVDTRGAESVK